MLSDYEEDELFERSINSFKLEEPINWSSISSKPSSDSKSSSPLLDEFENDTDKNMLTNHKLNNTHLLKLLSDLVQTFFQVTHEIENCLNYYVNNIQNQTAIDEQLKIHNQSNESSNGIVNQNEKNNSNNNLDSGLTDSFDSDSLNEQQHRNLMNHKVHQQVDQFEDEIISENVIPHRTPRHIKASVTHSFHSKDNSMILKESNVVNKNSTFFEVNCSYTVEWTNSKNCDKKNRIIENKKPYISASINVNNCYNTKKEQLIKSSLDSEDEAYSDATSDFSDSLECPSYSFVLKNRQAQQQQIRAEPIFSTNKMAGDSIDLNTTTIKSKQPNINELIKQSLISLTQCQELIKLPDEKQLNVEFEIDKFGPDYLDFLEQEQLVLQLCTRLKMLIQQLIQMMKSLLSDDMEKTLNDILNRNAELSAKLSYIRQETQHIESAIKNVVKKESEYKLKTIEYQHSINELKYNQERTNWLKERISEFKREIDSMIDDQRLLEFDDSELNTIKNLSTEDEEIFEDCLESLEETQSKSQDQQKEITLFDRRQFEYIAKSIQLSSQQISLMNAIDNEKYEMKQYQFEDYKQHLDCLKKLICSNKKFLNEQNFDRDVEKDTFNTKLALAHMLIKEKDLNLIKFNEKCEFLKTDLEELMTEKDEIQCKSYNQGRKLIDVNSKQEELKQEIDRLQNENNISFYRQEQIRNRVEEYNRDLEKERLLTDKLKFDNKLELDPVFYRTLDNVIKEINRFQMSGKIRDHLNKRSIERKKESIQRRFSELQKRSNNSNASHTPKSVKSAITSPLLSSARCKSLARSSYSKPSRANSFSSTKSPIIRARTDQIVSKRSKSFINEKFNQLNHRYSLKFDDDSYSKFVSKLKSPGKKRVLDDEELYSFKECSSLISLNNDLMDDWSLKSNTKSDSLFSLESDTLDEEMNIIDENMNPLKKSSMNAMRSLSEDTFYFSLMSEDMNDEVDCKLIDLYAKLDRCRDAEKLKHYAFVISNFLRTITRTINQCRDSLQNTSLDNKTKQLKVAELEKTVQQMNSMINKETFNLERLQNDLNNKHLKISELKNQIDSRNDNSSLVVENKQLLDEMNKLDGSMIENEENQFILKTNLEHLNDNLNKKTTDLKNHTDQLNRLKSDVDNVVEENANLRYDNQKLQKENSELTVKLKQLREARLHKRLKMLA